MRRRMTQGLSVVLSTAMVLSGSGIGNLSASAAAKEDSSVEASIDKTEEEEAEEAADAEEPTEAEEATEAEETAEAEDESQTDSADEGTDEESSAETPEDETEENIEESQPEETEEAGEETEEETTETEEETKEEVAETEEETEEEENKEEETSAESEETAEEKDNAGDEKKDEAAEEKEKETVAEKPQDTVVEKEGVKKVRAAARIGENAEIDETALINFIKETGTAATDLTLTGDLELTESVTAGTTVDKNIEIPDEVTLTISAPITSTSKWLRFVGNGNGNVIINPTKDSSGNSADTLTGKIAFGNKSAQNPKITLNADSSINATVNLSSSNMSLTMEAGSEIKCNAVATSTSTTANLQLNQFTIAEDAKITFKEGVKFTTNKPGIFKDGDNSFSSISGMIIAASDSTEALTAGTYTWDGNCFAKTETPVETVTPEKLKEFLESADATKDTLTLTDSLELTESITEGDAVDKNIIIPEGITLTISSPIISTSKWLRFVGDGTVIINPSKDDSGNPADTLIGKIALGNDKNQNPKITLKEGSSINTTIQLSSSNMSLTMEAGSEIKCNNTANLQLSDVNIAEDAKITFKEGISFTTNKPGIFKDGDNSFSSISGMIIAASDSTTALTAGTYAWDGSCFSKNETPVETVTPEKLKAFLESTDSNNTELTLTNSLELTESITAGNQVDKTITIPEGMTLTISAPITSISKWLRLVGNGEVIINSSKDSSGNPADTLTGKIALGNDKNQNPKIALKADSSINATIQLSSSNMSLTMEADSEIKCNNTANLQLSDVNIAEDAKITFKGGISFTTNKPGIFKDGDNSFSTISGMIIAASDSTDALTAGTYVWDSQNNYFAKSESPVDTGITETELQEKLQSENSEDITVSQDLTFSLDATVPTTGAAKTINIAEGKTLTVTGSIDSNGKDLFFTGKGTVVVEKAKGLSGKIRIGNGTKGEAVTCYIKDNGSIYLAGGLYMTGGGTLKMDAGAKIEGNTKAQPLNIASGATFAIADGASVILLQGYKFLTGGTGVNQKFSDLGKSFTMDGATTDVVVAEETATPADNQLTAGTYTWNGTCFYKSKTSGITTEEELIEALKGDKTDILVTENIKLMTPVTLTSNHILNVAEGKTLTITGELATGKARLTIVGKGKVLVRLKGSLSGRIYIGQENQQTPKGGYVVLNDEGKISGGNPYLANGGKLEINSPEGLSLSRNNLFTMENGGVLTGTGGMKLAEGAKVAGTSGIFSDQGSSFLVNDEVIVAAANTSPADGQLSAGVYSWNGTCFFKPVPDPLPSTGLNQGVLILSNESANRGSDEGWAWDAEKNVLNVNYRFKDVKQIQFVKSEPASIKLNADITLTPDEGTPAIVTGGNFIFRADEPYTLTVSGPIRSEGRIEFINQMILNQTGTSEDALLHAEGDVMIKGSSRVTVSNQGNGPAVAGNAVTIKEEAELNASGKGREPVVKANGVFGIGGPNATVTAVNRGKGFSVNKAPTLADYPDAQISVSTSASGRPAAEYSAENIQDYRYVKIRKALAFNEDATVAEVENAVETLAEDDYDAIDAVIMQIHNLDEEEKAAIKPETVEKLDGLLQKATGIRPKMDLSVSSSNASPNRQMKKATVYGALLALGLDTGADGADTSIEFKVEQIPPEENAYTTFTCALTINGRNALLRFPVTVKVVLPPEYFPFGADKLHLKGFRAPSMRLFSLSDEQEETAVERWLDFTYDGKDNSATFKTDILGTFSLVRQTPSGKPMPSGGGGGKSSSSGMSRSTSSGASTAGPGASGGNWVFDAVGWWYQYADQSYPSNGWFELDYSGNKDWYYFNQSGYMAVGWVLADGRWYYLNPVSDGRMGRMLTGWQQINGKWYYFNENSDGTRGAMLTDTWIGDDYVNGDGVWVEGKKK